MITERIKTAIVTQSSLAAYGLKQLLNEYFEQTDCHIFTSTDSLFSHTPDSFDLFFLDAESILLHYDFFLPRKNKTVILTNNTDSNQNFFCLSINNDISTTVDLLQSILDTIFTSQKNAQQEELTNREIEVLKLITSGKMNKEIADELCISLNTVLTHRKNITTKLGIKTVSGLTFYAMMNGYAD